MQKGCLLVLSMILSVFVIQVKAQTCHTSNIVPGKTITASSNPTWAPASRVQDGDVSTGWSLTESGNQYIMVDLGANYVACKVVVKWGFGQAQNSFKVEANTSSTGTFTVLANVSEAPVWDNGANVHTIDLSGNSYSGRYLRIYFTGLSSPNLLMTELEFYDKSVGGTNQPPYDVAISAPLTGASFTSGTSVTINASASDNDGTVDYVEFYNGTTLLGSDNTAPYSYTINSIQAGTYSLTVKAFDNLGGSTTSTPAVSIVVENPQTSSTAWGLNGNAGTLPATNFLGTSDNQPLYVRTNNIERLRVTNDGKIGIGLNATNTAVPTDALVAINGNIWARKLKVTQATWADYVFAKNYKLMPLKELEAFIKKYKHLPGVPTTKEVTTNGISVGDNQELLLKKIEELTLYLIELKKEIEVLKKKTDKQ